MKRRDIALIGALAAALILLFLPTYTVSGGYSLNVAVAFGLGVGILSGGLGMGGVWLMVPLMTFLFAVDIKTAIGTALTAQVVITLVGSAKHLRDKETGTGLATPLIIGGIIGTPVGVYLNTRMSGTFLAWLYAALLAVIAAKMIYELTASDGHASDTEGRNLAGDWFGEQRVAAVTDSMRSGMDKLGDPGQAVEENIPEHIEDEYDGEDYEADTASLFASGTVFGAVNSLLGTSSVLVVPFLDVVMRLPTRVATTVSLINVTAISIPASLNHMWVGNVTYSLAAAVAAGGVIGALLGSDLNERVPAKTIQIILVVLLIGMAYYMLPTTF